MCGKVTVRWCAVSMWVCDFPVVVQIQESLWNENLTSASPRRVTAVQYSTLRICRRYNSQFNFVFVRNQFWECFLADNNPSQNLYWHQKLSRNPLHLSVFPPQHYGQRQHSNSSWGLWSLPKTSVRNICVLHNLPLRPKLLHTGGCRQWCILWSSYFLLGLHFPHSRPQMLRCSSWLPAAGARS